MDENDGSAVGADGRRCCRFTWLTSSDREANTRPQLAHMQGCAAVCDDAERRGEGVVDALEGREAVLGW